MMAQDPWQVYNGKGRVRPEPQPKRADFPPGLSQIEPTAATAVPPAPEPPSLQEIEASLEASKSDSYKREEARELAISAGVPWARKYRAVDAQKASFLQDPVPKPSGLV